MSDKRTEDWMTDPLYVGTGKALADDGPLRPLPLTQPQPDPRPGATLTAAQVDEIEQRAEATTPGPWGDYDDSVEIVSAPNHLGLMEAWVCRCTRGDWISPEQMAANQQFIAASRADVPALIASLRAAWAAIEDYRATFDLRWTADMRAIERWRAGHPERELRQPDHADLVLWLNAENERYKAALEQIHWRADAADPGSVVAGQIARTALAAPGAGGDQEGTPR